MTRIDRVFEPVASRSRLLEARFARFTQALDALAPWWASSPTGDLESLAARREPIPVEVAI
jgi:hypothetical protein